MARGVSPLRGIVLALGLAAAASAASAQDWVPSEAVLDRALSVADDDEPSARLAVENRLEVPLAIELTAAGGAARKATVGPGESQTLAL
ncbi:MAG: hypothetical protein L0216_13230, partial [Planctomycetales bacterium]|nr:hypothetical protein [Planctomycetales bacterium]